jgi:uncharacterized membrane protein YcjF (UPF0283 family)
MTEKKSEKSDNSQHKQSSNVSTTQSTTPKKPSASTSNATSANANRYKVNFEYFKNFSLINETPVEASDSSDQIYKYSISSKHKSRKSIHPKFILSVFLKVSIGNWIKQIITNVYMTISQWAVWTQVNWAI